MWRAQAGTPTGRTPQKDGENRERNRGIDRSAAESHQRNMDGVSARGRGFPGTEETWVPEGDASPADIGGTGGNTENDCDAPPGGIQHSRQFVDAEKSVRIRLEKEDVRRQCIGLYAALGIDLSASGQVCPEAGSFPNLKVAGGGISGHRSESQGRKCRDLLGRRDWDRQLLELRARVRPQRAAPGSAGGDEKRAAEYALRTEHGGENSLYAGFEIFP